MVPVMLLRGMSRRAYFCVLLAGLVGPAGNVLAADPPASTVSTLTFLGTGALEGPVDVAEVDENSAQERALKPLIEHIPSSSTIHHVDASMVPRPAGNAVVIDPVPPGFNGISHRDQRLAGTGAYVNSQFSLEPPDQGLCVGGGFVLEMVNAALRVYAANGQPLTATTPFNQFLGLPPAFVRSTPPQFGPFLFDPRCYFDVPTARWFLVVAELDTDPSTGAFGPRSSVIVAVSQTSDPTGAFSIFSIDTTNDGQNGTPSHPNCPCLGDQPLIGADANGFYVSTNEFGPIPSFAHFNGAQVNAVSKVGIETGTNTTVTSINAGAIPAPDGGIWFSIQPATSPASSFANQDGGTEYFLSSLNFSNDLDNRIAVWRLTNTGSLDSSSPNVKLSNAVIPSQVYGFPPAAFQKMGETPLGDLVHNPLALLDGGDHRMHQVVFAGGRLWSSLNTVVQTPNGPTRVGVAYFVVSPTNAAGSFAPSIARQGYVAVNQQNVLYPSIGVNNTGQAVMTFTLAGPDFFPSAAYARVSAATGAGDVHIAGAGRDPEDGFTGYRAFGGGGTARWGDYSAAVAAADGSVWMATEDIPLACSSAPQAGCRTFFANWGTFVIHVNP